MKRTIAFSLAVMLVFITSCSKDSDPISGNREPSSLAKSGNKAMSTMATLPFNVGLVGICFDYDHANNTDDAIDIRKNWGTDYHYSEYNTASGYNDPFATVMGKQGLKVLVYVSATNADYSWGKTLTIEGRLVSGGEIGNFTGTIVLSGRGSSTSYGSGILTATGAVGSTVGINTGLRWEWHVTGWNGNSCDYLVATSGPHKMYRLFGIPKAPFYSAGNSAYGDPLFDLNGNATTNKLGLEPRTENVLDVACAWASGMSNPSGIVATITQGTYNYFNGRYNWSGSVVWPRYQIPGNVFGSPGPIYYPVALVPGSLGDCTCASSYACLLASALGIDAKLIGLKMNDGSTFYTTRCHVFTYNIVGQPIQGFQYHQVVSYNGLVYDPTASYDIGGVITAVSKASYLALAVSTDNSRIIWSSPQDLRALGYYGQPFGSML